MMADSFDTVEQDAAMHASCDVYSWSAKGITITAGSAVSIPIILGHCTSVLFSYHVVSGFGDIELEAFLKDGAESIPIISERRITEDKETIRVNTPAIGTILDESGRQLQVDGLAGSRDNTLSVTFRLSNEHSWITDKIVSYTIHAYVPRGKDIAELVVGRYLKAENDLQTFGRAAAIAATSAEHARLTLSKLETDIAELESKLSEMKYRAEEARKEVQFQEGIVQKRAEHFSAAQVERKSALSQAVLTIMLSIPTERSVKSTNVPESWVMRPKSASLAEYLPVKDVVSLSAASHTLRTVLKQLIPDMRTYHTVVSQSSGKTSTKPSRLAGEAVPSPTAVVSAVLPPAPQQAVTAAINSTNATTQQVNDNTLVQAKAETGGVLSKVLSTAEKVADVVHPLAFPFSPSRSTLIAAGNTANKQQNNTTNGTGEDNIDNGDEVEEDTGYLGSVVATVSSLNEAIRPFAFPFLPAATSHINSTASTQ